MKSARLRRTLEAWATVAVVASLPACAGSGISGGAGFAPAANVRGALGGVRRAVGLGPIVQDQFGGLIFGWDMNQSGDDGVLSETVTQQDGSDLNVIETFDQTSGKITKIVQKRVTSSSIEPVVRAVGGNDVGIIDVEHVFLSKGVTRNDHFAFMNPVSRGKINARSTPPREHDVVPNFVTNNQASSSQIMMALYRDKHGDDQVGMYAYDTARNAWGKRLEFPRQFLFTLETNYAAVDGATNEGVFGYLGRSRYNPHESPTFYVVDAATGKHLRSFTGLGYGLPNGMAIDPTTGTMCTTTAGDMDVEFYHLATGKGKAVQIPVLFGGGPLTNGAAVAADPVNHLFLVAQLNSTFSSQGGSTIIVYDEHGKLVEYINGFSFLNNFSVIVPHVAVNPANRTGYVNGPNLNELQEFTY
jgi:hypothetical protein